MLYIYTSSDDIFLCEAYNNELKGSSSEDHRELNRRKKALKKLVKDYREDISDITENADDLEWYLKSRGRQLEEEIGTNDFITPVLNPVINESIKKSKTVVSNSNRRGSCIQKNEDESQNCLEALENALKFMVAEKIIKYLDFETKKNSSSMLAGICRNESN
jgi:uncharacterized protein YlxW (UPF0749 family)